MTALPLVTLASILSHSAMSGLPASGRLSVSDPTFRQHSRNKVGRIGIKSWIDENIGFFIFNADGRTVATRTMDADSQ